MDGLLQSPRRLPRTGRGQEDSAPGFPPPRVQASPIRRLFQDLTPCWCEAGEGLTHFYLTLTPAPGAQAWPKGGTRAAGPVPQSLDNPSLCVHPWGPGDTELRDTWSLFSRVQAGRTQLLKLYRTAGHIKINVGGHIALGSLDREWQIRQEEQIIGCTHPMDQHPMHCSRPWAKQAT